MEPTIYPALTAWGFTTGENRIPDKGELEEILRDVGYRNVRLSGNEVTLPDGTDWKIGLRDPFGESYIGVLSISDRAVVTSGNQKCDKKHLAI